MIHYNQRYTIPSISVILIQLSDDAAGSSIEITERDLGLVQFLYNNVFNALLNYMQCKLAFTHHMDMYI